MQGVFQISSLEHCSYSEQQLRESVMYRLVCYVLSCAPVWQIWKRTNGLSARLNRLFFFLPTLHCDLVVI